MMLALATALLAAATPAALAQSRDTVYGSLFKILADSKNISTFDQGTFTYLYYAKAAGMQPGTSIAFTSSRPAVELLDFPVINLNQVLPGLSIAAVPGTNGTYPPNSVPIVASLDHMLFMCPHHGHDDNMSTRVHDGEELYDFAANQTVAQYGQYKFTDGLVDSTVNDYFLWWPCPNLPATLGYRISVLNLEKSADLVLQGTNWINTATAANVLVSDTKVPILDASSNVTVALPSASQSVDRIFIWSPSQSDMQFQMTSAANFTGSDLDHYFFFGLDTSLSGALVDLVDYIELRPYCTSFPVWSVPRTGDRVSTSYVYPSEGDLRPAGTDSARGITWFVAKYTFSAANLLNNTAQINIHFNSRSASSVAIPVKYYLSFLSAPKPSAPPFSAATGPIPLPFVGLGVLVLAAAAPFLLFM